MVPIRHYPFPADMAASFGAVVPAATLGALRSADEVLRQAHAQAREIVEAAHAQSGDERQAAAAEAEREVWRQAQALLQQLAQAREELLSEVSDQMSALSQRVAQRLLVDLPPAQRLLSSARLVLQDALPGRPVELRVHPSQREAAEPLRTTIERLHLVDDADLAPDAVVMRMDGIRWSASFEGNLQRLLEAIAAPVAAC